MATITRPDSGDTGFMLVFTTPRKVVVRGNSISITGRGREEDIGFCNCRVVLVTCSCMDTDMARGFTTYTGVTGITLRH